MPTPQGDFWEDETLSTLQPEAQKLEIQVRALLIFFVAALLVSGLTAFPLRWELRLLDRWVGPGTFVADLWPSLSAWVHRVYVGLSHTYVQYPFMAYGTDWLAFAHIVIAVAFWGPLRDPVRNRWVVEFGMIACVLVLPLALICGPLRGIPWFWRVIDCSFGVLGIVPLWLARRRILRLEQIQNQPIS
jgi:hypothetical protein